LPSPEEPPPPPPIAIAYTQVTPAGMVTDVPDVIVCCKVNLLGSNPALEATGNTVDAIRKSPFRLYGS
jgi:hypothetical protein